MSWMPMGNRNEMSETRQKPHIGNCAQGESERRRSETWMSCTINWRSFYKDRFVYLLETRRFFQRACCSRCLSPYFQLKTCKNERRLSKSSSSSLRCDSITAWADSRFLLWFFIALFCNCVFSFAYLLSRNGICKTYAHYWLCVHQKDI